VTQQGVCNVVDPQLPSTHSYSLTAAIKMSELKYGEGSFSHVSGDYTFTIAERKGSVSFFAEKCLAKYEADVKEEKFPAPWTTASAFFAICQKALKGTSPFRHQARESDGSIELKIIFDGQKELELKSAEVVVTLICEENKLKSQISELAESIKELKSMLQDRSWKSVGPISNLETILAQYPLTHWQLGVKHNTSLGSIHEVTVNSWNRGIRVSVTNPYPMGDDAKTLKWGNSVFTKNLDGEVDNIWYHKYYQFPGTYWWGNGATPTVELFVRRL